jgi:chromosome segregation ATPase
MKEVQMNQSTSADLKAEIDALSLGQALVDFELANARVLDLTARLVEANERVRRFGREADAARGSLQAVSDDRDRMGADLSRSQSETARVSADAQELRRVIDHRDTRVADLEREIAARDAQVVAAHTEMEALRSSTTFRVASKIGSLKRFLR